MHKSFDELTLVACMLFVFGPPSFSGSSGAKSKSVTISDFSSLKRIKSFISILLHIKPLFLPFCAPLKLFKMSDTPPKRRAADATAVPPQKSSKMSATAPPFNPSRPLSKKPAASFHDIAQDLKPRVTTEEIGDAMEVDKESEGSARVTKPLPGGKRNVQRADFVPVQASVPKSTEDKENTRRLIVVLSQVRFCDFI